MKFSSLAVLAAISVTHVAGKVYLKEQFNDEVSYCNGEFLASAAFVTTQTA
jgi:hypothetical protein